MPLTTLPLHQVGALALTRAALGVGIGLVAADHLAPTTRRTVGTCLITLGAVATVPLMVSIVRGIDRQPSSSASASK